jgi:hypothetical protein
MPTQYTYSDLEDVQIRSSAESISLGAAHELQGSHQAWGKDLPSFSIGSDEIRSALETFDKGFGRMEVRRDFKTVRLFNILVRAKIRTFEDLQYVFQRPDFKIQGMGKGLTMFCSEVVLRWSRGELEEQRGEGMKAMKYTVEEIENELFRIKSTCDVVLRRIERLKQELGSV